MRESALAPDGNPLVKPNTGVVVASKTAEPTLAAWGRVPELGREVLSEQLESLTRGAVLSRGLGRSYGDSSLPASPGDKVVATRLANRILGFDEASGVLRAEAGFSLSELNRLFIPRGYFSPVTPGTKFVTLGGMVASDVHGKNHHVDGCFGSHVRRLRMRLADDSLIECSPEAELDLFCGTVGGMGLARPHPRGRSLAEEDPEHLDLLGEPARPRHRRVHGGAHRSSRPIGR